MTDNFDTAFCYLTDAENAIDDLKDYIHENYEILEQYDEDPEIEGKQINYKILNIKYLLDMAWELMCEDFAEWEEYNKQRSEDGYNSNV